VKVLLKSSEVRGIKMICEGYNSTLVVRVCVVGLFVVKNETYNEK
jgi:hypothetical protein